MYSTILVKTEVSLESLSRALFPELGSGLRFILHKEHMSRRLVVVEARSCGRRKLPEHPCLLERKQEQSCQERRGVVKTGEP